MNETNLHITDLYYLSEKDLSKLFELAHPDDVLKASYQLPNVVLEKIKPFIEVDLLSKILQERKFPSGMSREEVDAAERNILKLVKACRLGIT